MVIWQYTGHSTPEMERRVISGIAKIGDKQYAVRINETPATLDDL
jgi:hypothetical protein